MRISTGNSGQVKNDLIGRNGKRPRKKSLIGCATGLLSRDIHFTYFEHMLYY